MKSWICCFALVIPKNTQSKIKLWVVVIKHWKTLQRCINLSCLKLKVNLKSSHVFHSFSYGRIFYCGFLLITYFLNQPNSLRWRCTSLGYITLWLILYLKTHKTNQMHCCYCRNLKRFTVWFGQVLFTAIIILVKTILKF